MKNKEIEYGKKIENPDAVLKYLKQNFSNPTTINISRKIYKQKDGKYFIKISTELSEGEESYVFSIKEDLLKEGQSSGLKVAEELDINLNKNQLEKLKKAVSVLGFEETDSFEKVRHKYEKGDLEITVDIYEDGSYLEIEGPSKTEVMELVEKIEI